jgi:hypothetical protein
MAVGVNQAKEMPRWLYGVLFGAPLAWIIFFPILLWSLPREPAPGSKLWYWVGTMIVLVVFMFALGYRIKDGRLLGVLIDERNKMTLSRLQLIIWTVVILSGYATAALWNLFAANAPDPLAVQWPEELWWLLGISTTSLVGSPLILQTKKQQVPNTTQEETYQQRLSDQPQNGADQVGSPPNLGNLAVNPTPRQASLADMFRGDEIGNEASVDISKIQLFFFTILIVIAYGTGLGDLFLTTTGAVEAFPALSESILVLLGISHAGYLGYKGVSHSAAAGTKVVPNVVGLNLPEAQQMVEAAGLRPEAVPMENEAPENEVLRSEPAAGTIVDEGAIVMLIFSSGPPGQ